MPPLVGELLKPTFLLTINSKKDNFIFVKPYFKGVNVILLHNSEVVSPEASQIILHNLLKEFKEMFSFKDGEENILRKKLSRYLSNQYNFGYSIQCISYNNGHVVKQNCTQNIYYHRAPIA